MNRSGDARLSPRNEPAWTRVYFISPSATVPRAFAQRTPYSAGESQLRVKLGVRETNSRRRVASRRSTPNDSGSQFAANDDETKRSPSCSGQKDAMFPQALARTLCSCGSLLTVHRDTLWESRQRLTFKRKIAKKSNTNAIVFLSRSKAKQTRVKNKNKKWSHAARSDV